MQSLLRILNLQVHPYLMPRGSLDEDDDRTDRVVLGCDEGDADG